MADRRNSSVGRPRSFETEAIVDGALELFWRKGFAATTTRALETELGLNQSSLYNAFGSKRQLLVTVLARYQERVTNQLLVPLEESRGGLSSLTTFFGALARWVATDGRRGCLLINLMAEDGGGDGELSTLIGDYRSRMRRGFRAAIKRAVDLSETADCDTDARADLLVGLVLGINIGARGGASANELRGIARAARTQIVNWRDEPKE